MISVVVRTKNEGRWIKRCLTAVCAQDCRDVEVIVVDNESSDDTVKQARCHTSRVVTISDRDFSFGRAINRGIEAARGEFVAIVSGHCIPVHDRWLSLLRAGFSDRRVAGVYGRQVPMPDSHPLDKRDLWTTFGPERRTQRHDYFFHNGNSMIRRDVWQRHRFDEMINGVEDRDWAKRVQANGYTIAYEPLAAVHHFHGIHQSADVDRAERVVKVIELIHNGHRRQRHAPRVRP
jgi:glycosyltransferase involved in cell wall biosynthesis